MKYALVEESGRISQIEDAPTFAVQAPLGWFAVPDDTTTQDTWDGTQVIKYAPAPLPSSSDLEAALLDWLNGGVGGTGVDLRKAFKAKVVSDLAFRLGKAPGTLTASDLNAERSRLAAIYKAL